MILPHDELGAGSPVVLLHAGIADRTMWAEHLQPLAEAGLRAVAMDLPGFGEAAVPAGEQAPWVDVLATMDALGIDRAALVGNSFGGAVALRVAAVAPERVSALVLVSAPGPEADPSEELEAAWAAEEAALARGDVDAAVRAVTDHWILSDAPRLLRERVATMQRNAFFLQAGAGSVGEAPDPLADWPGPLEVLGIPVLVAAGEHDMRDFREAADALVQALPQARQAVIEEAGHLAPLERPDAFRELLLGFLA
jgi:pimeloyl-ACP methyl ester carboxylesterase